LSLGSHATIQMSRIPLHVATFLDILASQLHADLGRNLVGLYLYGSLTQGAFDARRSDVDCVAVIRRRLSPVVVSRLRVSMRGLRGRDSWMRRLQLLILIKRELLQFNGDGWLYQFGRLTRTGSDGNPIIWANILKSGQVVFGANPRTFVPPITPELMRAALKREIDYLYAELVRKRNSEWRRKPAYRHYAALTACRILYTLESGRVAPKRTAAAWALRHLPLAHRAIVRRAIAQPPRTRILPLGPLRGLLEHIKRCLATAPVVLAA
jgi:aminoglycoside adenylyltransferase-like protein